MAKPPVELELIWERDLVLSGRSVAGPSPMQALAFALAGCMAMDVIHVIKKGRHDLKGLRADLVGARAEEEPRRFTRVELRYTVNGNVPEAVVQRAIDLSREKYCSVWHSMRQDIEFVVTYTIANA
jgi:putative redox protein